MHISVQDKILLLENTSQKIDNEAIDQFLNYFDTYCCLGFDLAPLMSLLNKSFSTAEKNIILEKIEFIYKIDNQDFDFLPQYPAEAIAYCKKLSKLLSWKKTPVLTLENIEIQTHNNQVLPEDIFMGYDFDNNAIALIKGDKEKIITAIKILNQNNDLTFKAKPTNYNATSKLTKIILEPK